MNLTRIGNSIGVGLGDSEVATLESGETLAVELQQMGLRARLGIAVASQDFQPEHAQLLGAGFNFFIVIKRRQLTGMIQRDVGISIKPIESQPIVFVIFWGETAEKAARAINAARE